MTDLRKLLDDAPEQPVHYDFADTDIKPAAEQFYIACKHQLPALLDRIEKLEEALRFYCADNNEDCYDWAVRMNVDCGNRAKEALNDE